MTARRQRSPRGQGASLRTDLVRAARDAMRTSGDPSDVTVRGIAASIGVSPNAVYLHFEDRDALLVAAVVEGFTEFVREVDKIRSNVTTAEAQLRAAHDAYMRFASAEPGIYRTMFGGQSLDSDRDDLNQQLAEAALPAYNALLEIVSRCIEEGVLPPVGPNAFTRLLFVAEHGWSDMAGTPRGAILPTPDDVLDTILALTRHPPSS